MNIEKLQEKPYFTTQQAKNWGVSPRMLSYYVESGKLERIARGVFRASTFIPSSHEVQWEGLAIAASNIDQGVICLLSALSYYDLSDEFVNEYWIAVPNSHTRVKFPMTRVVRLRNMKLGVKTIKMANMTVQIFDKERTILEVFRLLDIETAIKALKRYVSGEHGKPDIRKLLRYSKELRVNISHYLLPLTL